jgi:uncharacterized protein YqjF (DUF2071 family)
MTSLLRGMGRIADGLVASLPLGGDDVRCQRDSLEETDHRPWPLPEMPWMLAQTWRDLMFAHWRVDPATLRRVVPRELPLDRFEGAAWIGITPFLVTGFRPLGTPPAPVVSSFPELNVRTYVTLDGKPGIYFLSLDADSRLAVAGARRSHRLPYFRARMSARRAGEEVQYASERVSPDGPAASFQATYRGRGDASTARPGSLAHWLSERYCLYTLDERHTVLRADIHHRAWRLREAAADIRLNTMTEGLGIELEGLPILHLSARQDTVLWSLQPAFGD